MAYLDGIAVLDIETSGLSPDRCAILSIGIVSYRERLNEFYREYYPFDGAIRYQYILTSIVLLTKKRDNERWTKRYMRLR